MLEVQRCDTCSVQRSFLYLLEFRSILTKQAAIASTPAAAATFKTPTMIVVTACSKPKESDRFVLEQR